MVKWYRLRNVWQIVLRLPCIAKSWYLIKQPTSFHKYSILLLILNWFLLFTFGSWSRGTLAFKICQRATYFSLQTKILLCVIYTCAVSILQKYLLYVFLSLNFFRSYFVHWGVVLFSMLQLFTFLCLKVLFIMPTFKTIHFWSKEGLS